jgi:hypothetical protein
VRLANGRMQAPGVSLRNPVPSLGYRDSPRPRHDLPPRVVLLLRPFFRYSDWRNAWVLRLVGERFGPVIQSAPGHEPPPPRLPRLGPSPLRRPAAVGAPAIVLLAGGIAVAAVLGFVIARAGSGGGGSTSVLAKPVSDSLLQVSLPNGWQRQPSQIAARFGLTEGLGAASGGRLIVVGRAATTDPSLLPASILDSVRGTPVAQVVTLQGATFYRYSSLGLRQGTGSQWAYAVPTVSGTVLALCRATSSDTGLASLCQSVVRSIRLRSGSLAPGLVPSYASTVTAVINRLNAARASGSSALATARTASRQASAAADAQAAASLAGARPGPAEASNNVLVTSLRADADAYSALANAAAHRSLRAYRISAAAVAQANATLSSALAALGSFGYRVS